MKGLKIAIRGMHCGGCASRLGRVIGRQVGVESVDVDFMGGTASLKLNGDIDLAQLEAAIETAGFVWGGVIGEG